MLNKFEVIENEVNFYKNTSLEQNPTFAPKMGDVYKLIDLFTVSKFRDGDKDSLGFKKVFFNIVNFVVDVCAKMLDIDTKDIDAIAEDGYDDWTAWLLGKELKNWMKEKYFARQLNQWAHRWAKYGDLWLKKVGSDVLWIPPQNMIFRVNASDYKTVPLIERHEYGADELRIVGKQAGWENIEDVISTSNVTSSSNAGFGSTVGVKDVETTGNIVIYETWFPDGYLEGEKSNWFITAKDYNKILAEDKKDCPFKKLSWEDLPGRLAGRGRVEQLFEDQIYLNRIANYKSTGFHWTSKHWYQTRPGAGVEKNLFTQADDGEILLTNANIDPVINEERNLNAYGVDEQRWTGNALRRTFTAGTISGQGESAGKTANGIAMEIQQATQFYKQKKEEYAEFIKEVLWDWIIPEFSKEANKQHKIFIKSLLEDGDSNSEKFFNLKLNERMNRLRAMSGYLTPDQWAIRRSIQSELLKKENLDIPKGFYENLKYKLRIVITGEELDVKGRQAMLTTIIQTLGANPGIMQDKTARKAFLKSISLNGFNPKDFFDEDTPTLQNVSAERAGSIAAPTVPATPQMAQVQTKLA